MYRMNVIQEVAYRTPLNYRIELITFIIESCGFKKNSTLRTFLKLLKKSTRDADLLEWICSKNTPWPFRIRGLFLQSEALSVSYSSSVVVIHFVSRIYVWFFKKNFSLLIFSI